MLSIKPDLFIHLISKGRDYPIYEDCFHLFIDNHNLEGIKVTFQMYKRILNFSIGRKKFNHILENKIIQFFIDNHSIIENLRLTRTIMSSFHQNGQYLMADLSINKVNFYNILLFKLFQTTPYVKLQYRCAKVTSAVYYFYDELNQDFVCSSQNEIRAFILKRLGENLAK